MNLAPSDSLKVYESENLIVLKLSQHIYQHISFLNTDDFGKVASNGMLVINNHKGVVFDTPTDDKSSLELIKFVTKKLKTDITAVIPTHFHEDCIGGIANFVDKGIPVYANNKTMALFKTKKLNFSKHINEFNGKLSLNIGEKKVYAEYFGEGHTEDNIIGYFPEDETIFGGCLIKEKNAGKGYLGDANTAEWPATVQNIKLKYPDTKIVIPGHGEYGGTALLDYTIQLFQ
ncbi:subclass B1 metallo-beta-lactamase [Arenibacter sp. F26102]|uniref:subclass B1 metallo-beta-lactamase n=1 Tax=Arenibacter sp. F26102 TaxID=2926416 RepID=UPI00248B4666|nr:subclass B1 metallo-beta-lactamase [Arenibacter sp. F26102]